MNQKLTLYTSIIGSLLLFQTPIIAVKPDYLISQAATKASSCEIVPEDEVDGKYSQQQLQILASRITMRVMGDENGGSGTIIAKRGNKYLIVTNSHVIQGVNSIRLQAVDGKNYAAKIVPNTNFEKFDLALLEFQTTQNYCLPQVADFLPNEEMKVVASGFSGEKDKIVFRQGKVRQISNLPLKGGYSIGYSSNIEQGMSGGAIINTQGTLIGINGKSAYPILNRGYVYQHGSKPKLEEIEQMKKLSWGVPIRTFLAQVNSKILTAYNLPLPKNSPAVATTQLTGWLRKLEEKAKQFTVRIDSSSGGNGSGIIIAKDKDTYTVLTVAHVLCESENGVPPCPDNTYKILASDGKNYPVEKSTIKIKEGVDLGILKFTVKNQNYRVATLSDYNSNEGDYIFTAGYPKLGNQSPWKFTMGQIFDKEIGLLRTRQSDFQGNSDSQLQTASSFRGGYELVYTSMTYGGMSGGPLLDSQGRVIGIHGSAEGEEAIDEETGDCGVNSGCKVQLGYSLGISVRTFLGLTKRFGVEAQKIEENIQAPQLTTQQVKSIEDAVLSADVSTGNAKASVWLERGNQLWRLRRYKEAVEAFDKVIQQKPAFVYLAYYGKGLALGNFGKIEEARVVLEQSLKLKPDFAAAWALQSEIYEKFKQLDKALIAINNAIQSQPKNPTLYAKKFIILSIDEKYIEAESAITETIRLSNRAAFYLFRAINYYMQGKKLKIAIADVNQAIKLNPQFAPAFIVRGILNSEKNENLALADYNKAIEINPKYIYAYHNRGDIYRKQKKWNLALADYDKAIEINSEYVDAYRHRGDIYRKQKKWNLALANYNKAIEINSNYTAVYNNRGLLYEEQKKWDLALADYNKAIEINPKYIYAYHNRGDIYRKQKKWDLALADYNQAIEINHKNAKPCQ